MAAADNLWTASSELLFIPFRENRDVPSRLRYTNTNRGSDTRSAFDPAPDSNDLDLSSAEAKRPYIRHSFDEALFKKPARLEVNGRKGRRVVCVVYDDKIRYRIFDLDNPPVDAVVVDGDEQEDTNDMVS